MRHFRRFYRVYHKFVNFVAIICVLVGLVLWGIVPGVEKIRDLWKETNDLRTEVSGLRQKIAILDGMDEQQLKDAAQSLRSAIPVTKDAPGLMMEIENLTSKHGLNLDSMNLSGSVVSSDSAKASAGFDRKLGVGLAPVIFTVQGPVANIRDMLDTVLRIRRIMNIQSFDLSINARMASLSGTVNSNITAHAFFQPPPTTIGKIGDAIKPLTSQEIQRISEVSSFPVFSEIPEMNSDQVIPVSANKPNPFLP